MVDKLKKNLEKRPDLLVIQELITPNSRVLDLGCGKRFLFEITTT